MQGPVTSDGLFREEALAAGRRRFSGEPSLASPPSARAGVLVAGAVLSLLAAAAYALELPERTRARGVLMPRGGLVTAAAAGAGVVAQVAVREGEAVSAGRTLVTVSADRRTAEGSLHAARRASLRREVGARTAELETSRRLLELRLAGFATARERARTRLRHLRRERALERERLALAEARAFRRARLAAAGHLARDRADEARADVLAQRARVENLTRQLAALGADLEALTRDAEAARGEWQLAKLRSDTERERLERELAQYREGSAETVVAPVAGTVARLLVKRGDVLAAGQPAVLLYAASARLEAWLYLPAAAAGRVRVGDTVALRYDAFPHTRYGIHRGRVVAVSRTSLTPRQVPAPLTLDQPVFEVRAALESRRLEARGESWPLAPGTAARAEIVHARYRLYERLLRPVLALLRGDGEPAAKGESPDSRLIDGLRNGRANGPGSDPDRDPGSDPGSDRGDDRR